MDFLDENVKNEQYKDWLQKQKIKWSEKVLFQLGPDVKYNTDKIFLHSPKTGGRALRLALYDTRQTDVIRRHTHKKEHREMIGSFLKDIPFLDPGMFNPHTPLKYVDPEKIKDKQVYMIVRNPWSKFYSHYLHVLERYDEILFFLEANGVNDESLIPKDKNKYTFDAYIASKKNIEEFKFFPPCKENSPLWNYHTQKTFVEGWDKNVDFLRFENLKRDVLAYLDIDMPQEEIFPNPEKPKHNNYKEAYTSEQIQYVADLMTDDINYWGFDFDTGATKNAFAL